MPDPILHHFDLSPFAEKIRKAFGLKGLAWRSVQIPMVMPKPQLMPLTGGYRKTPVLQVGADIYCDTHLIARELESRFPTPSLFAEGAGLPLALGSWSDKPFFEAGAGLSMGVNRELPEALLKDRKAFFNFMDFSRLPDELPYLYTQIRAHAELVDLQLRDGRAFLQGTRATWADINAWFVVWMARTFVAPIDISFAALERMASWETRMKSIGHGVRSEIDAEQALDIARTSDPRKPAGVDAADPLALREGERVSVTPDDYGKEPVLGQLVSLQINEVAVLRHDARVGDVVVHFPRIGYRVSRA